MSTVHFILGDFNIDGLDAIKCSKLHNVLHNYEMIVSEPTHLDGAVLDHVYLLRAFLPNIYFPDHDDVRFKIDFDYLPDDIDFKVDV